MASRNKKNNPFVFSTKDEKVCPGCGNSIECCICTAIPKIPAGDGFVRISRETKGRKGAGVTLVSGLPLAKDDLNALAKQLKQRCGVGGAVKGGVIELQGDKRDILQKELIKSGYKVKICGG